MCSCTSGFVGGGCVAGGRVGGDRCEEDEDENCVWIGGVFEGTGEDSTVGGGHGVGDG